MHKASLKRQRLCDAGCLWGGKLRNEGTGGNRCRSRRHRIWAYTIWMLSFKKKNVRASYHFIIYTSIESLCFIPEANVICQTHLNFKKWVSYFRKNLQKHTTTCTHAWDPRWALDTAWSPCTIGFPGKPPGKRENFHSTSFSIIQTELCEFFKKIPEGPKGRHKQTEIYSMFWISWLSTL